MPCRRNHLGWALLVLGISLFAAPEARGRNAAEEPPPAAKANARSAERQFRRAARLHTDEKQLQAAFEAASEAASLDPENLQYATAREQLRQRLVRRHIERGNRLLNEGRAADALTEFQQAYQLDPQNPYALQRMRDAAPDQSFQPPLLIQPVAYAGEIELQPAEVRRSFDFRGDSRQLVQLVARAYGLEAELDPSFVVRRVRFKLDDADFASALRALTLATNSFYLPLGPKQILLVRDTPEQRRAQQRMLLRTFYLPFVSTPQQLQEMVALLRSMLDIRFATAHAGSRTIVVRARREAVDAAAQIITAFSYGLPQVMLHISAWQISKTAARDIGISLPLQFTVFNVNTEARNLLNTPGLQELINQLIRSGDISDPGNAAAAALLAAQQSQVSSPLFQGFATFGGGTTLSGVVVPPASLRFQESRSSLEHIQDVSLRAQHGNPAIFHVGERFPVLTNAFAPLSLPGQPRGIINQSLVPGFNYEDLGISLKVTPYVNEALRVSLQFELQIKSLGAQSFNGIPVISDREYKGTVSLENGQTSVIAGALSSAERDVVVGVPGLGRIPVLGRAFSTRNKESSASQLFIVITPHVVRPPRDATIGAESYLD